VTSPERPTAGLKHPHTHTRALDAHTWLPREPRHRWHARVTWQPIRPLSLWTEFHLQTRQWENLGNIYQTGYTRIDLGGSYRVLERWGLVKYVDLTARIQSLANEAYQEGRGFPALGITGIGGGRGAFAGVSTASRPGGGGRRSSSSPRTSSSCSRRRSSVAASPARALC